MIQVKIDIMEWRLHIMWKFTIFFSVIILMSCASEPVFISELLEYENGSLITASITNNERSNDAIGSMNRIIPGGFVSLGLKIENASENQINILWENSTIMDENGIHKIFVFKKDSKNPSFYFDELILPGRSFSIFQLTSLDVVNISVSGSGLGSQFGGLSVVSTTSSNTFNINGSLAGNSFRIRICYKINSNDNINYYDFIINMNKK
jgi:hypothetical protein